MPSKDGTILLTAFQTQATPLEHIKQIRAKLGFQGAAGEEVKESHDGVLENLRAKIERIANVVSRDMYASDFRCKCGASLRCFTRL